MPKRTFETMLRSGYLPRIIRKEKWEHVQIRATDPTNTPEKQKFNKRDYVKKADRIQYMKNLVQIPSMES